ncbi:hypothetical protein [Paenibacillus oleatilyticus]|uniref:Tail fiber protein n=1 Tax=Paenibacillus oleatilyticus TaxID=2594886 RepID=A0ABV4VB05_9BACL
MAFNAKTNWQLEDTVTEQDMNRIEQGIKDAHENGFATDEIIGSRTIDDSQTPSEGPNSPTNLWSMLGNMIKQITGESKWATSPVTSLRSLFNKFLGTSSSGGHTHDGTSGNGPKLDPTKALTYVPLNRSGDKMSGHLDFNGYFAKSILVDVGNGGGYLSFVSNGPTGSDGGYIQYVPPGTGNTKKQLNITGLGTVPLDLFKVIASQYAFTNGPSDFGVLNLADGSKSISLNDAPIWLRGKNGTDPNHFIRYFDSRESNSLEGARISGNTGVQIGTMDAGASNGGTFHSVASFANAYYPISMDLKRMPNRSFPPNTYLGSHGIPAGVKLGAFIANYEDVPNAVGCIVANRYHNDNTSIFEAVNLHDSWNPMFTVRGQGQTNVWGRMFVHNGAGMNVMNTPPSISLAIGDNDTGLNWAMDGKIEMWANNGVSAYWDSTGIRVEKSFTVGGTKSAIVTTDTYGDQLLYAVESPENRFEDFGEAQLDENGEAVVQIDPIFLETVEIHGDDYQVFIQGIDGDHYRVPIRDVSSFKVTGQSNSRFMYRIVAWRKGYRNLRFNYAQGH